MGRAVGRLVASVRSSICSLSLSGGGAICVDHIQDKIKPVFFIVLGLIAVLVLISIQSAPDDNQITPEQEYLDGMRFTSSRRQVGLPAADSVVSVSESALRSTL